MTTMVGLVWPSRARRTRPSVGPAATTRYDPASRSTPKNHAPPAMPASASPAGAR